MEEYFVYFPFFKPQDWRKRSGVRGRGLIQRFLIKKEANHLAELKLISPLLSNMEVVECVSVRGAAAVYIVRSTKSGQTYILKHISVPESQKQVDALLFTGAAATAEDAQKYYEQVVSDYRAELDVLETLSASPNLDCFRSYQIAPKEDGVGYDMYLLAEHRKTLVEYLADNAMTKLCAVNLAMDLCSALIDLRQAGLIHRDVKPSNIYLSPQGHFLLGDLGIAKISDLKYCTMPESMLSSYSAPELFSLMAAIEPTTDIYSVGLILYRIFNGNHAPFEDENTSAKAADRRRVTGEALPVPMYADYEISEIILKACAFKPEDRYQTPQALKDALVEYMKRNQVDDTLIVPPIAGDHEPVDLSVEEEIEPVQFADTEAMGEDFKENFSPDTQMLNSLIDTVHKEAKKDPEGYGISGSLEPDDEDDAPDGENAPKKRRKKSRWLPIALCCLLLIAGIGAAVYFFIIAPSSIHVNDITLVDTGTDYITVQVDSGEKDGSFMMVCSDTYGNTFHQSYQANTDLTFTGLVPGTQYTVSVEPQNGETPSGNYSIMATTLAQTEILSFTATPVAVTQAELNLIILDGPDPGTWTVSYTAEGQEPQTATFSGHSTVIAGLASGTEYTFTLQEPENTKLIGVTTATFSTVPTVSIVPPLSVAISSSSAILSWNIEGDAPESWTVTITGPDDYSDTQIVATPSVTFEGLTPGETYEIIISTPTMLQSVSTTITPNITKLSSFTANVDGEDLVLDWACEVDPAEPGWKLEAKIAGVDKPIELPEAEDAPLRIALSDLVPDADYTFTIALKSGEKLEGDTKITYHSPAVTEKFTEHGFGNTYLGFFLKPANVETVNSTNILTTRNNYYTVNEQMAFALQTLSTLDTTAEEDIAVMLVVRDADGKVVTFEASQRQWNTMWEKNLFVGTLDSMPQKAGTYTLEIYFNHKLAATKDFNVRES